MFCNIRLQTLTPGQTYYFALKAYYYNNVSGFSNEISYTVPAGGTTTTSAASTTSTTASTPPTTTSIRATTTSIATTSTVPVGSTSTTSVIQINYTVLGGKGSNFINGSVPAAQSERNALAEPDQVFTDQGAIAIFDITDTPLQISVGWDEYNTLNGEARIATGDIDGDKKAEIIIGLGPIEGNSAIPGGKFQILDDDFTSLGWGQIDWSELQQHQW